MVKAEFHPEFVRFVLKHRSADEVPDLTAWPHSEADFLRVRKKIREAMVVIQETPSDAPPPVDG